MSEHVTQVKLSVIITGLTRLQRAFESKVELIRSEVEDLQDFVLVADRESRALIHPDSIDHIRNNIVFGSLATPAITLNELTGLALLLDDLKSEVESAMALEDEARPKPHPFVRAVQS